MFRVHPDKLKMLSQDGEIKVTTTQILMLSDAPTHQFNPAEMLKKDTKRYALFSSNFKDGKF